MLDGEIETEETLTFNSVTDTTSVAVLEPSIDFAVIVTEPLELAFTIPNEHTDAILLFELDHFKDLSVADDGLNTGLIWYV